MGFLQITMKHEQKYKHMKIKGKLIYKKQESITNLEKTQLKLTI